LNVCLLDGKLLVSPPNIEAAQELVHHSLLLAHLFVDALTDAPAMQRYTINSALLDATFPAIEFTGNVATPYIITKTIAYVHAIMVDSISEYPSDSLHEH
jgi:hypothetical protein